MIELKDVHVSQGDFCLKSIHLRIEQGEYAVLMGETGCGKTTLIEAICGLRSIDNGRILLDGNDVTRMPSAARQIGYVPQDGALFPTMRVDRQILFGLELRKVDRKRRLERLEELADSFSLKRILTRYPNRLSGGEKQRVALARAIAYRPKLLCLDEPLTAIDAETHHQLSELLQSIHRSESVTILHITHNLEEAKNLGTVRFRLQSGKIQKFEDD